MSEGAVSEAASGGGISGALSSNSGLISGILGALGTDYAWGNLAQKKALKRSKKLFAHQLLEGPSLQMEGLRKAGLNPILAAGALGHSGGVPMVKPQEIPSASDAVETAVRGYSARSEASLRRSQESLQGKQAGLVDAERRKADMEATRLEVGTARELFELDLEKLFAPERKQLEINQLRMGPERLAAEIANYQSQSQERRLGFPELEAVRDIYASDDRETFARARRIGFPAAVAQEISRLLRRKADVQADRIRSWGREPDSYKPGFYGPGGYYSPTQPAPRR